MTHKKLGIYNNLIYILNLFKSFSQYLEKNKEMDFPFYLKINKFGGIFTSGLTFGIMVYIYAPGRQEVLFVKLLIYSPSLSYYPLFLQLSEVSQSYYNVHNFTVYI